MEKTGGRPQGWSSLTRQYRDFSLGGGGGASVAHHGGFSPLPSLPYQEVQSRTVPLQQRQAASGQKQAALNPVDHLSNLIKRETQQTQQQIILSRLRERHSWADEVLVQEVLQGVGGIEAVASAQLQSMAPHESFGNQLRGRDQEEQAGRRSSTSTGAERDAGTLPQSERATGSEEVDKDGDNGLESSHRSLQADDVPIEPEWEDDDVYSRARREALRMNRYILFFPVPVPVLALGFYPFVQRRRRIRASFEHTSLVSFCERGRRRSWEKNASWFFSQNNEDANNNLLLQKPALCVWERALEKEELGLGFLWSISSRLFDLSKERFFCSLLFLSQSWFVWLIWDQPLEKKD